MSQPREVLLFHFLQSIRWQKVEVSCRFYLSWRRRKEVKEWNSTITSDPVMVIRQYNYLKKNLYLNILIFFTFTCCSWSWRMTYINKVHCHSYVHVSTHRNVYIYSSIALNSNSQTLLDKQRYLNRTILFIIVEYNKVLFRLAASVMYQLGFYYGRSTK